MITSDPKTLPAGHPPKLLENPEERRQRHAEARLPRLIVLALVLFTLLLLAAGWWRHHRRQAAVEAQAHKEERRLPTVNVTKVRRSPTGTELLLPGNITPITEAYIYARASGYVRKRYVDMGDRVRPGQILAEIESPELDQQVLQGRAALSQSEQQIQQSKADLEDSRAALELARVTWERYRVLVAKGALSRQEGDQQLATYRSAQASERAAQANVAAAEQNTRASRANLERLILLQNYEKVRAPFAGVVTARNFDIGALVSGSGSSFGSSTVSLGGTQASGASGNAGASAGAGSANPGELFRIAQIGTLRVLVNVPQENAPTIRTGLPATVFIQEYSKRQFRGTVTRTSNSVDLNSRTLLAEVQVSNPEQVLLPGMYAQVQFVASRPDPPLLVPGDSIITTAQGLQVAIVTDPQPDGKEEAKKTDQSTQAKRVHIQSVEVGRDYGPEIEITSGLQGWEYVIVNPGDVVEEGALVRPIAAGRAAGAGGQQRRGQTDQHPAGISSASEAPPTQGAQSRGGGGGRGSKAGSAQR